MLAIVDWGYSSVGRALLLHGRCQRFESAYLHKKKEQLKIEIFKFIKVKRIRAYDGYLGVQKR